MAMLIGMMRMANYFEGPELEFDEKEDFYYRKVERVEFGPVNHGDFCRTCGGMIEKIETPSKTEWVHINHTAVPDDWSDNGED